MSKYLKLIITLLLELVVLYLIIAYVQYDLTFYKTSDDARFLHVIFSVIIISITYGIWREVSDE